MPLEEITAPTMIISARDDLFNTLPAAEFAAGNIPGAKLVIYNTWQTSFGWTSAGGSHVFG
ncbi:alpha/beta fold hydrolase [Mesorhizobium sp. 2RAF45]|uniref:alpha/beta fold hydrolase n=1 Tax=Mesorhizobium sp. 2RAF45 TaxID=3233001 RepID=UPI003F99AABC